MSFVLFLALYFVLRYGGLWGETDTSVLTSLIHYMVTEGTLLPEAGSYAQGYGYPVLSTFLVNVIGMDVAFFQLIFVPFLAVWLVLPAWLLYREFIGSARGATLATLLLFVQPEFLFVVLRSSHEKFTRGLMLLCFYLLVRNLHTKQRTKEFLASILAFYLSVYALITMNNLLATSFIAAVGLALLALWSLAKLKRIEIETKSILYLATRLQYAVGISLILALIFTFYAYEPAQSNISLLKSIGDKLVALLLDFQTHHDTGTAYGVVNVGWINLQVYLIASMADWLLLTCSLLIWLNQTIQIFRQDFIIKSNSALLLWAFYGAFALIGAISIVVDVSGALASNLQHRIFPSFGMLAAPVVAGKFISWRSKNRTRSLLINNGIRISIAILAVLSILKATNEPLLSNYWIFTQPSELQALVWSDEYNQFVSTWTDFNERLTTIYRILHDESINGNKLDAFVPKSDTVNFLVSNIVRFRSERWGLPLPIQSDSLRIYDNGDAQIYHRRAITPYQK